MKFTAKQVITAIALERMSYPQIQAIQLAYCDKRSGSYGVNTPMEITVRIGPLSFHVSHLHRNEVMQNDRAPDVIRFPEPTDPEILEAIAKKLSWQWDRMSNHERLLVKTALKG